MLDIVVQSTTFPHFSGCKYITYSHFIQCCHVLQKGGQRRNCAISWPCSLREFFLLVFQLSFLIWWNRVMKWC